MEKYKTLTQDPLEWDMFKTWAKKMNVSSYLEIGSYAGFSAREMAREVLPKGSRITLVEASSNKFAYEELLKTVEEIKALGMRVNLIEGDSTNYHVIEQVKGIGVWPWNQFDLCFIDANHALSYVWQDYLNYDLLSVHTAFHDIDLRCIEKSKQKHNGIEQAIAAHLWMILKKWHGVDRCTEIINDLSDTPRGIGILSKI